MKRDDKNQHLILRFLTSKKKVSMRGKVLKDLSILDFTTSCYRESYRRIKSFYNKKGKILSWKALLNDGTLNEKDIRRLKANERHRLNIKNRDDSFKVPSNLEEVDPVLKNLWDQAKHKRLVIIQNELTDKIKKDSENWDDHIEELLKKLHKIKSIGSTTGNILSLDKNNIKKTLQDFRNLMNSNFFIPTGFKDFDKNNLGIPKDAFWLICAQSGCGKSTMGFQLGMNMKRNGARVCYMPLEMSDAQLLIRGGANLLSVEITDIINNYDVYEKDLIKVLSPLFSPKKNEVECFDIYRPEDGETFIDTINLLKGKYDIILGDYVTLFPPMPGFNDPLDPKSLAELGRCAKIHATNSGTIIGLMAQMDEITLDVKYCKALRHHASNAWFWKEKVKEIENSGSIFVQQPKARNQNPKGFRLKAELSKASFSNFDGKYEDSKLYKKSKKNKKGKKLAKGFDDIRDLPSDDDI